MARITILPHSSEVPELAQMSKGDVKRLVKRGLMDMVSKHVARRRKIRDFSRAEKSVFCRSSYIPSRLPPAEVENCKFQEPRRLDENVVRSRLTMLAIARRLCAEKAS